MKWTLDFLPEADDDLIKIDGSAKTQILKGITKVLKNPLPRQEGGYGTALRNQGGLRLEGLCKIKFKKLGMRVVYALKREGSQMTVVVIAARSDNEVYDEAARRRSTHGI
jgi:mRNA interferase RelE/StbE